MNGDTTTACVGCIIFVVAWAGIGALLAWGIEWAWNAIVPQLFHGPGINYLQACALYFLVSVTCGLLKGLFSLTVASK